MYISNQQGPLLVALLTIVGLGCVRVPDDDPTSTSADKDGMGASVGDTGVFGALEVTVNADSSVLKYSTGDGWTV